MTIFKKKLIQIPLTLFNGLNTIFRNKFLYKFHLHA